MFVLCLLCLFTADVVFGNNGTNSEDCVEWASSVPAHLHEWTTGVYALLSVSLYAAGSAQPLAQLKMPFLANTILTISLSAATSGILVVSIAAVLLEFARPSSKDSLQCDILRVVWVATPIIAGTAGSACAFLLWLAYHRYATHWQLMDRDDKRIHNKQLSIPPSDKYGNGSVAIKMRKMAWVLNSIWVLGIACGVLLSLRGDVLNGTLSIAGIIALWSNAQLPEWNANSDSSGLGTATSNVVDLDCMEVNVIGDSHSQTAVFLQPKARNPIEIRANGDVEVVHYIGRIYAIANAHAASTDFKGDAFRLATYMPIAHDSSELANCVVQKTEEVRGRLVQMFQGADAKNPLQRAAFTALTTSILDKDLWDRKVEQRQRLSGALLAKSWCYQFCFNAGGVAHYDDSFNQLCDGEICTNPLHRWLRRHSLKDTADEEAKYLLGQNATTQPIINGFEGRANELWERIRDKAGGIHENSALLISIYLYALQAMGAIDVKDADYFPTCELALRPFSENKFKDPCDGMRISEFRGNPLIDRSSQDRRAQSIKYSSEYDKNNTICFENERKKVVCFHPKAIVHVAVRVLWRAILIQVIVWTIVSARLLAT